MNDICRGREGVESIGDKSREGEEEFNGMRIIT